MKYHIVDGKTNSVVGSIEEVEVLGYKNNGVSGGYLREELREQPTFIGLAGPMWSGDKNVLRYETAEMNELLSQ